MAHWTEKQTAVALVGAELRARGWQLYGWYDDRSDVMTDYFAPASWAGVATKGDAVALVGASVRDSGRSQERRRPTRGEDCPRCAGAKVDPSGWTLEAARAEPERYHAEIDAARADGARALLTRVVSPIPFEGGRLRCVKCQGAGYLPGPVAVEVESVWPTFQATPKGAVWHVERRGRIVASGSGVYTIASSYNREERSAKLGQLCDRIEAAAGSAPVLAVDHGAADGGGFVADVRPSAVNEENVEVSFQTKPAEPVRAELKAAGFRWSGAGGCWYGKRARLPERYRFGAPAATGEGEVRA